MLDAMVCTLACPQCNTEFAPRRSNQKFCSRSCQKNAARGNRLQEHQDRSKHHYDRTRRLFEMIYKIPPSERLGAMKHILSFVTIDSGLRNILTDPALLSEPRHADDRMNIAKAANAYTKMFFGVSISTYVRQSREGSDLKGIPLQSVHVMEPVQKRRCKPNFRDFCCIRQPSTQQQLLTKEQTE